VNIIRLKTKFIRNFIQLGFDVVICKFRDRVLSSLERVIFTPESVHVKRSMFIMLKIKFACTNISPALKQTSSVVLFLPNFVGFK
jgi:hypothetical protein